MTEGAEDDDMIVVLISQDDGKDAPDQDNDDVIIDEVTGEIISTKHIKKEVNYNETIEEDFFEVVQKYGIPIDLPVPIVKQEKIDEDFEYEFLDENTQDSDYVPDEQEEHSDKEYPETKRKSTKNTTKNIAYEHRFKLLSPNEGYSFVDELRNIYPKFVDDHEALILHLAEIMKGLKPPAPPDDYCKKVSEKCYVCSVCKHKTETKAASERHYAEKHGPRYLNCFSCGVDFRCQTNLYKHEKRCLHPDAEYVLRARAICVGFKGSNRPYLQCYQTRALTPRVQKSTKHFECNTCTAVFRTRVNLEAHELLHAGIRPFKCDQCNCSYTSKYKFKRHLMRHGGGSNRFECDYCGRAYSFKGDLAVHMGSHIARRFPCPYKCGRKYASNFALRIHIDQKHLQIPPPCACNICPKRFFKMSLLKVHMKKAHGLLLMTRNMLMKQLPRMDPDAVKSMFGDVAAYVHKGTIKTAEGNADSLMDSEGLTSSDAAIDVNKMQLAQFDPDENENLTTVTQVQFDDSIITGDLNPRYSNMPDLDNSKITGDLNRRYNDDMPDLNNLEDSNDAPIITGDLVNFSEEFSKEFANNSRTGFTLNIDNNGRVQIKKDSFKKDRFEKENFDATEQEDMELEETINNKFKVNINEQGVVTIKEEAYEVPVCQDISLEEVLKSNKKFKVIMINK